MYFVIISGRNKITRSANKGRLESVQKIKRKWKAKKRNKNVYRFLWGPWCAIQEQG